MVWNVWFLDIDSRNTILAVRYHTIISFFSNSIIHMPRPFCLPSKYHQSVEILLLFLPICLLSRNSMNCRHCQSTDFLLTSMNFGHYQPAGSRLLPFLPICPCLSPCIHRWHHFIVSTNQATATTGTSTLGPSVSMLSVLALFNTSESQPI